MFVAKAILFSIANFIKVHLAKEEVDGEGEEGYVGEHLVTFLQI
jgi:hypothetical protein